MILEGSTTAAETSKFRKPGALGYIYEVKK